MSSDQWTLLCEMPGQLQAQILRGLLEAQGISVVLLSQEGVGDAYALTVGPLGLVPILVPHGDLERAHEILDAYFAGEDPNNKWASSDEYDEASDNSYEE